MTPADIPRDFLIRNQHTCDQCCASIRDGLLATPASAVFSLWEDVLREMRSVHEDESATDIRRCITAFAVVGMFTILQQLADADGD